jgi:hypothetical protein
MKRMKIIIIGMIGLAGSISQAEERMNCDSMMCHFVNNHLCCKICGVGNCPPQNAVFSNPPSQGSGPGEGSGHYFIPGPGESSGSAAPAPAVVGSEGRAPSEYR